MADPVGIGDVVAGKYVVQGVLGRGGVGVVVSAEHVKLGRRVALKFLRPELADVPDVVQRFLREGRAAAQLHSEHVARVLDADTTPEGAPYLVMELLEGRDLWALVKDEGPLPLETAVDYVLQACEAVAEAHAAGILHRDLKLANLFVTRSAVGAPLVKVLDFGLSKIESLQPESGLTSDNHVMGSPHFMSPEQMRSSRDVDARSDIWALGVVLYTLLAGRVPFQGGYLTEVCSAVLSGDSPSLTSLRPDAPPELEQIVARCLRLEREDRFPSVPELAVALAPFAGVAGAPLAARIERLVAERRGSDLPPSSLTPVPVSVASPPSAPPPAIAATALESGVHGARARGRVARGLLVVALGGLLVAGAVAFFRGAPGASTAASPAPSVPTLDVPVAAPTPSAPPAEPSVAAQRPSVPPAQTSSLHRSTGAGTRAPAAPASSPRTHVRPRGTRSDEDVILELPH